MTEDNAWLWIVVLLVLAFFFVFVVPSTSCHLDKDVYATSVLNKERFSDIKWKGHKLFACGGAVIPDSR